MEAYLLIGGNLGDKLSNINKAVELISKEVGTVKEISSIYESEPWGFDHSDNFYNIVIEIDTDFDAHELLSKNQKIETTIGRVKDKKTKGYQSRLIDIDILFYDGSIIEEEALQIPHKQLHKRRFTLMPLVELNPQIFHPKKQHSVATLLHLCNDPVPVWKVENAEIMYLQNC